MSARRVDKGKGVTAEASAVRSDNDCKHGALDGCRSLSYRTWHVACCFHAKRCCYRCTDGKLLFGTPTQLAPCCWVRSQSCCVELLQACTVLPPALLQFKSEFKAPLTARCRCSPNQRSIHSQRVLIQVPGGAIDAFAAGCAGLSCVSRIHCPALPERRISALLHV